MNLLPCFWNAVIVTALLGTSAVQAASCSVPGGTSSSPTDFARYVSNEACNEFILGDGWYTFPKLSRSEITIRAEHAGKAQIKNGFAITAPGVTIDGISRDGERGPIAVHAPGTIIRNCRFSNFGKAVYGRKVLGRGQLARDARKAMQYVLGLGTVHAVTIGTTRREHLRQNLALIEELAPQCPLRTLDQSP